MSRLEQLLPAAVVLFATVVPLAKVGVDRGGEPRMTITVTHRELMQRWGRNENSGEVLTWSWGIAPELDSLTAQDLGALGFSCREEEYDCGIRSGRNGWIVVTLDTVTWQRGVDSMRRTWDSLRAFPTDTLAQARLRELTWQLEQQIRQTVLEHGNVLALSGIAVGQKRGGGLVFNLRERTPDEEGKDMNISAQIALNGDAISVAFEVVYVESGDSLRADVPFSR